MSAAKQQTIPSRDTECSFVATILKSPHLLPMILLGLASFISLAFILRYLDPTFFPDTQEYERLASDLLKGELNDSYFRTPGYPLFLAFIRIIFGDNYWYVAAMQVMLSSVVPFFLYGIFFVITRCRSIATVSAFSYFIFWDCQAMSVAVLTESLTQLFLVASTFVAVLLAKKSSLIIAVIAGITLTMLLMVRPAFLPLSAAYVVLIGLIWYKQGRLRRNIADIIVLFAIPMISTLLWCQVVKRETGKFTISHITGVALLNQVSAQIMTVKGSPDPEMIELLQAQIRRNHGEHLNVGWPALKSESEKGVPPWETADRLKALSVWMIKENPRSFLAKIGKNAREYITDSGKYIFTSSNTHKTMLQAPVFGELYKTLDAQFGLRPGRLLFFFVSTLVLSIGVMLLPGNNGVVRLLYLIPVAGIGNCMLGHILVNGADLGRYSLPAKSLYFATAITTIYMVIHALRSSPQTTRGCVIKPTVPTDIRS